jgi:hypothetical protein
MRFHDFHERRLGDISIIKYNSGGIGINRAADVHTSYCMRALPAPRILRLEAFVARCGERSIVYDICTLAHALKEFLALRLRYQRPLMLGRTLFHWPAAGEHTALSSSETGW